MKTFANLEAGQKIFTTTIFSDFTTNEIDYHEIREILDKNAYIKIELDNDMIVSIHSTKKSAKQYYEKTDSYLILGLTKEDVIKEVEKFKRDEIRSYKETISEMARIIKESQHTLQIFQEKLKNITSNLNF